VKSRIALEQAKQWLSTCDIRHGACTLNRPGDQDLAAPKKLIDVHGSGETNEPRLVATQDINVKTLKYLALAYHFDDDSTLVSSSAPVNLSKYKGSILPDHLPAAFEDAIDITKQLGLRYLWIKSLCEMEDSPQSHHTSVFAGAYCTIAAAASSKVDEGCFEKCKQILPATVTLSDLKDDHGSRASSVTIFIAQPHIQQILDESCPLYTFTDSMVAQHISPRILHFTSKQILWQCQTIDAAESLPGGERKPQPEYTTSDGQVVREIIPTNCRPRLQDVLSQTISPTPGSLYSTWHRIVEEYTQRNVTCPEAILTDIHGLVAAVQAFAHDECVAGLWRQDLIRSLLWRSKTLVHKKGHATDDDTIHFSYRPHLYVAPSWSWESVTCPVDYSQISGEHAKVAAVTPAVLVDEVAGVISPQLTTTATTSIGLHKLRKGHLLLVGKLKSILAHPGPGWPGTKYKPFKLKRDSGDLLAPVVFDDPDEMGDDQLYLECLWCYPRELNFMDHGRWHGFGLALLKMETETEYRRVGYFDEAPLDYWDGSERKEITIV
jgi:hypothetical protein